jgi:2-phosphoglycerate kinase
MLHAGHQMFASFSSNPRVLEPTKSDQKKIDEKNEKTKETIRKKFTEYLERAEKLKDYLAKKAKKKPVAMMGDGGVWPFLF